MPNRILKESFFLDDRIALLSDFEFRVWIGLMTTADNYGSGDARPAIIKGRLFALSSDIRRDDVMLALHGIEDAGLITFSENGGIENPYQLFESGTITVVPTMYKLDFSNSAVDRVISN